MSDAPHARKGHAVLDLPSRDLKAAKIASLLDVRPGGAPRRMLEIGCGSGGISRYFGTAGPMGWDVTAVDVEDVRLAREGYAFRLVEDVRLPFPDGGFDVVLSNHVIEHVGDDRAQALHLQEVRRVLRPDGVAYLAVPSRWMLVEPHYRLPFLSWLPQRMADAYVRMARRGTHYDCRPLGTRALERKLRAAGFEFRQRHGDALRLTYALERPRALVYRVLLRRMPEPVYAALRRAFPTLIYTLRVGAEDRGPAVP